MFGRDVGLLTKALQEAGARHRLSREYCPAIPETACHARSITEQGQRRQFVTQKEQGQQEEMRVVASAQVYTICTNKEENHQHLHMTFQLRGRNGHQDRLSCSEQESVRLR